MFYDCKKCKACCNVLNILLGNKNRQLCCLAVTVHIVLQERRVATTKKKNHLHFWRNFSANHNQAHPNLNQKRIKGVQLLNKRIRFLLADEFSNLFIRFQSTVNQSSLINLHSTYSKSLFSESPTKESSGLDFSPDSVTIAVIDLVQNITMSSEETRLAAWQLLLSQRQDFLDNHLPRVSITQTQEGAKKMRDEILSSVGAQDVDTSSYQVFDLEDIEFNWEKSQFDMDAVFRPGIDTLYSPTTFDDLSMEGSLETPIVLDEEDEEDKENAPPHWSSPKSVRPTEPPRLQRSRAFGATVDNVPDYVFWNLFQ